MYGQESLAKKLSVYACANIDLDINSSGVRLPPGQQGSEINAPVLV